MPTVEVTPKDESGVKCGSRDPRRLRQAAIPVVPHSSGSFRSRSGYSRQRCASVSSRIRPANDRETSRNVGNGWSTESAGQESDSAIGAGSESGPENTLKVETRVRTPLGLPGETGNNTRPDPSDIHHQRSARLSRS
jgi:hypothetical protein